MILKPLDMVVTHMVSLLVGVLVGAALYHVGAPPKPLETRAANHCRAVAERIRRDLNAPSDATHRDLVELVAGDEIYVCLGRTITIDHAVDTIDDLRRLP
jgi:hypothetical protein